MSSALNIAIFSRSECHRYYSNDSWEMKPLGRHRQRTLAQLASEGPLVSGGRGIDGQGGKNRLCVT